MILYIYLLGLEKYLKYLTRFGLTLSVYDIFNLDLRNSQHGDHLTGLGLILLNTGVELFYQPSRDVFTKVWILS